MDIQVGEAAQQLSKDVYSVSFHFDFIGLNLFFISSSMVLQVGGHEFELHVIVVGVGMNMNKSVLSPTKIENQNLHRLDACSWKGQNS